MYDMEFARLFRQAVSRELLLACSRRELTPGKLAKKAGLPLSTVNNVMRGLSPNPGVLTLLQVCEGLELPLEELLHRARLAATNPDADPTQGGDFDE